MSPGQKQGRSAARDKRFDLLVIGSGPAGEKGAAQAAYFGKRVALIEAQAVLGGARIHTCALPSKALREAALLVSGLQDRELVSFALNIKPNASMADLMCHRDAVVLAESQRVEHNLERHGVRVVRGTARFKDPHTLTLGSGRELSGEVILIATGSTPMHLPDAPVDDPGVLDTDQILNLARLPRSLVIAGGGVIGCEYASMFAPLGVKVTLLERRDRLMHFADAEISQALRDSFVRLGIDVRLNVRAEAVRRAAGGMVTELSRGKALESEYVLFCAGRNGNTATLQLAAAGVRADERGRIPVNEHFQTAVPHIYAAGDVIGFPGLASTGMEQARVAMCRAFDLKYKERVSPIVPLGINTIPEFAMVGDTEEQAAERGVRYETGRALYRDNVRGRLAGDTTGLLKLVFEAASKKLLGVHIIGDRATELIHVGALCLQREADIDAFIDAVFNYPTLSELYKYAAYDGLGRLAKRVGRTQPPAASRR